MIKIIWLLLIKAGPMLALSAGMKTVIIVSKCLRVTNFKNPEILYEFHFKGVCAGETLRKLLLCGKEELVIKKNEEYLMFVQIIAIEQGVLRGRILKAKRLEECWDKS